MFSIGDIIINKNNVIVVILSDLESIVIYHTYEIVNNRCRMVNPRAYIKITNWTLLSTRFDIGI